MVIFSIKPHGASCLREAPYYYSILARRSKRRQLSRTGPRHTGKRSRCGCSGDACCHVQVTRRRQLPRTKTLDVLTISSQLRRRFHLPSHMDATGEAIYQELPDFTLSCRQ